MVYYQLIVNGKGEDNVRVSIRSEKQDVKEFLDELKRIINDKSFDIDTNLLLISSKKSADKEQFSTPYTLIDLDYDAYDVVDRLKELEVKDYSETLFDKDDDKPPLLFVFGKDIHDKQVYIKLKIKGEETRKVLCLSFHYAEKQMSFPYA